MKSGASSAKLSKATEAALVSLGFKFLKNEGREMQEFDVTEPEAFIVRIRSLEETEQPSPIFGFMLPRRQSACTDFSLVVDRENPAARARASASVPVLTATASLVPTSLANLFSNSRTYLPPDNLLVSNIAAISFLDFFVTGRVPKGILIC